MGHAENLGTAYVPDLVLQVSGVPCAHLQPLGWLLPVQEASQIRPHVLSSMGMLNSHFGA